MTGTTAVVPEPAGEAPGAASLRLAPAPDVVSSQDGYALRFAGPVGAFLLEVQTRTLLGSLSDVTAASVLDVGGGHAQIAPPLAAAGHRVTVLASHPGLHGRVRRCGVPVAVLGGRLEDPPVRPRAFDVTVAIRMLAHADDWREMVAGLCRTARRAVIVDFPARSSVNRLAPGLFRLKQRLEPDTRRFRVLAVSDVAAAFRENGFDEISVARELFAPLVLHRRVGAARLSRLVEGVATALGLTRRFGSPVVMTARRRSPDDPLSPAGDRATMTSVPVAEP